MSQVLLEILLRILKSKYKHPSTFVEPFKISNIPSSSIIKGIVHSDDWISVPFFLVGTIGELEVDPVLVEVKHWLVRLIPPSLGH